jgi:hypothetical protein
VIAPRRGDGVELRRGNSNGRGEPDIQLTPSCDGIKELVLVEAAHLDQPFDRRSSAADR